MAWKREMTDTHIPPQDSLFVDDGPTRTRKKRPSRKKTNDLDGATWLSNSISVWNDIRKTREERSLGHPAMFPTMLVERLIESFTSKREHTVLDPFMGSGSTVVVLT